MLFKRKRDISPYWLFVLDLQAYIGNEYDWKEEADKHWEKMGEWDRKLKIEGKETQWRKNWYEQRDYLKRQIDENGEAKYMGRVARLPPYINYHTTLTEHHAKMRNSRSLGLIPKTTERVEDYYP